MLPLQMVDRILPFSLFCRPESDRVDGSHSLSSAGPSCKYAVSQPSQAQARLRRRIVILTLRPWESFVVGLVQTFGQLLALRLLLGLFECGLFPGISLYLTGWYRVSSLLVFSDPNEDVERGGDVDRDLPVLATVTEKRSV